MDNEYANFREIIRDIIKEEIEKVLRQDNIEKKYAGTIIDISISSAVDEGEGEGEVIIEPYTQRCAVDLGFTVIGSSSPNDMIPNKSGEVLNIGDSVTVYGNSSGSFVNSYIGVKHSPIN